MKVTPQRARWVGRTGAPLIRVLGRTWRIRSTGHLLVEPQRALLAFLHGDMLIPAVLFRGVPAAIMISRHGDGQLIAEVIERLGKQPVRGSSSRGGAKAFLEMTQRHADVGWALTPDGPRGPRGTVHPGVVHLAAVSGRMITPLGCAVSRGKRFASWDRFVVPAPFARIAAHFGEPLAVPADSSRTVREELARELERRLAEAHEEAVRALANW